MQKTTGPKPAKYKACYELSAGMSGVCSCSSFYLLSTQLGASEGCM